MAEAKPWHAWRAASTEYTQNLVKLFSTKIPSLSPSHHTHLPTQLSLKALTHWPVRLHSWASVSALTASLQVSLLINLEDVVPPPSFEASLINAHNIAASRNPATGPPCVHVLVVSN